MFCLILLLFFTWRGRCLCARGSAQPLCHGRCSDGLGLHLGSVPICHLKISQLLMHFCSVCAMGFCLRIKHVCIRVFFFLSLSVWEVFSRASVAGLANPPLVTESWLVLQLSTCVNTAGLFASESCSAALAVLRDEQPQALWGQWYMYCVQTCGLTLLPEVSFSSPWVPRYHG